MRIAPSSALFTAILASSTFADTIEVPGDFPTISQAVANASPGDTVRIGSGTYFETVYVPVNKVGLRLEGKGTVILDAHPSTTGTGDAIRIYADDVTVKSVTIRHMRGTNNGMMVAADDVTVDKVIFEDGKSAGVSISAGYAGTTVKDCRFTGLNTGVRATFASDVRIEDCDFSFITAKGIASSGTTGLSVKDCDFRCSSTAIDATDGGSIAVENCEFRGGKAGACVSLFDLAQARIEDNEFVDISGYAIVAEFVADATVEGNEVEHAGGAGVSVHNSSVVIEKNKISHAEYGIRIDSSPGCTVEDNEIDACSQDGIRVVGSNNLIVRNEVKSCLKDGIRIHSGSGNQVIDNKVEKNGGEGLCNMGSNTLWDGNSAKKNRIDLANGGSVTATDNKYKTGGVDTVPQIED